MKKYEKFILDVLAFCCFMLQVVFVLSLLILVTTVFFSGTRQEIYEILSESIRLQQSSLTLPTVVLYLLLASVIQGTLAFVYLNCIRNLMQNLNDQIYFEKRNLQLIKRILIFYAASTILEAAVVVFNSANQITLLSQNRFEKFFYLFDVLLMVMGIYVIYMVFKQGVRLKKESDAFI